MDWVWFLFSFQGRINRAKFHLAGLVIFCWMIFLVFLFLCASALLGGPQSFHFDIDEVFALAGPATYRAPTRADLAQLIAHVIGMPLFLWVFFAVSVKRLHDRDKSGWWMVPFFIAPGLYKQFEDRLPYTYFLLPVALAVFVFMIWGFVEMYFLKGTASTNRFGPDPLAEDEATQPSERGLGSRGPAWDQQREIELVPHTGSPPPSIHVKREA
jgi:uncharacterized membrane protein YhaH (DUF805 family)